MPGSVLQLRGAGDPRRRTRGRDWHCRTTTYGPSSSVHAAAAPLPVGVRPLGNLPRYPLPRVRARRRGLTLTARLSGRGRTVPRRRGRRAARSDRARATRSRRRRRPARPAAGRHRRRPRQGRARGDHRGRLGRGPGLRAAGRLAAAASRADDARRRWWPSPMRRSRRMVAACGASVSLFTDADGTAQREAWRRWHLGTVQPLARLLAHELTLRLETDDQAPARQVPDRPRRAGRRVQGARRPAAWKSPRRWRPPGCSPTTPTSDRPRQRGAATHRGDQRRPGPARPRRRDPVRGSAAATDPHRTRPAAQPCRRASVIDVMPRGGPLPFQDRATDHQLRSAR